MQGHRGHGSLALFRQPWAILYLLFLVAVILPALLYGPPALRYRLLTVLAVAGLALGVSAYLTRCEGSRPGPTPRPFVGLLLASGMSLFFFLKPDAFLPLPPSELRDGLSRMLLWLIAPIGLLLLARASWSQLGLPLLFRVPGRFRSLLSLLVVLLSVPAIVDPQKIAVLLQAPWWRVALALPLAYVCGLLGEALPEEFLFRQLLQPRLQVYFRRPTPAIVLQALLYGLAVSGASLARETAWPLAFSVAVLEQSAFGLLYGLLRDRTGSLALPVLLHAWVAAWTFLPEVLSRMPL